MCFDLDSRPPIAPIAGGALDSLELTLEAADGNRFRAFRARATMPTGAGILILPDVRGLHPFYEELALRFAENGVDALAIDYFGRTAGVGDADARGDGFVSMPHVEQVTWEGLSADIGAAAAHLRMDDERRVDALFTIGFCFGGQNALDLARSGADIAGVASFHGLFDPPGLPPRAIKQVAHEVFHRTEQIAAEPPAIRIRPRKATLQQMREKRVRMIARRVRIKAYAPQEDEYGLIVGLTQIAQRSLPLGRRRIRTQHQRPACGHEAAGAWGGLHDGDTDFCPRTGRSL